jgi:hypothetical protein
MLGVVVDQALGGLVGGKVIVLVVVVVTGSLLASLEMVSTTVVFSIVT